jgi:hypothetical protein
MVVFAWLLYGRAVLFNGEAIIKACPARAFFVTTPPQEKRRGNTARIGSLVLREVHRISV